MGQFTPPPNRTSPGVTRTPFPSPSTQAAPKGKNNWMNPQIVDEASAREAIHNGFVAAMVVGTLTALVAFIAISGAGGEIFANLGIDGWAFLDAGAFFVLGFWLRSGSRIAAVLLLLLYIGERLIMISNGAGGKGIIVTIFIVIALIHAVRGTFALAKYRSEAGLTLPQSL